VEAVIAAELTLVMMFLATALLAEITRNLGLPSPFHLREMHHFYLGILLVAVSLFGLPLVGAAGVLLSFDDWAQHFVQTIWDESYQSPLAKAFAWAYARSVWVRRLTFWLDGLFR
jgi:hypothetical protein